MTTPEDARQSAWALYVSLHCLACSVIVAPMETHVQESGAIFIGDLDDARMSVLDTQGALTPKHPQVVAEAQAVVGGWETAGADRLARLLRLLQELESLTGATLPLPPPRGP
ncbi:MULTISPECIES: hypothetical protein [Streptomyces]|uniref:hypothetical protein n=1 Tax=Streptomyces TaxID=1883 RepID=UPI00345B7AD0